MTTGERIRDLRQKLGLSQSKLASKVETDSASISRWERDQVNVSQRYIVKLAKALSTTSDYLLGKTNVSEIKEAVKNTSISAPEYIEKMIQANQMVVYENNGERLFIPATPDGFNFFERVRNSNNLAMGQ